MNYLKKNSVKYRTPYFHLICDNFLENYHEYDLNYPIEHLGTPIRMDKDLTFGDPTYENIYNTPFKHLHEYVYSDDFILDFLDIFDEEIDTKVKTGELLYDPRKININPKPYEMRNFISCNNMTENNIFLFPRMDFGVGYAGYGIQNGGRGVHTDNVTRLISIMLFFTDQKEIKNGQHQMFVVDENYKPLLDKSVELKKNRLLASIQSNDAYHSVNPLLGGERRAIYMSISSSTKLWADYTDKNLKNLSKNRK